MSDSKNGTAADAGNIAAAEQNVETHTTPNAHEPQEVSVVSTVPALAAPANIGIGKKDMFPPVMPWAHPVKLDEVLDEIRGIVGKHVVIQGAEKNIVALWIAFSYCLDSFRHSPRLLVTSPEMQCGKTTLLEIIGELAYRPFHASNMSPAVIYRVLEKYRPTLLADEADTYIYDDEQMRNILNQGHTKAGAWVARCAPKSLEPEFFYAYSAMVIGQISTPPATVTDRSIPVFMKRKKAGEKVLPFLADNLSVRKMCGDIQSKLLRWANDNAAGLSMLYPVLPPILQNRNADKWRPLYAIAELAGGAWPQRVNDAAQHVMSAADADESGMPTQLLSDIRDIVKSSGAAEIKTAELLEKLNAAADRPWATVNRGRPLDANKLANMLRPFGARASVMRFPDGDRVRGYDVATFADAFSRYLP
jgi:putative DNA primase/helicase